MSNGKYSTRSKDQTPKYRVYIGSIDSSKLTSRAKESTPAGTIRIPMESVRSVEHSSSVQILMSVTGHSLRGKISLSV